MQIITKSEYDEAVQSMADDVFDPLGDSLFDVDELVRLVREGDADFVRGEVLRKIDAHVALDHPFEGGTGSFQSLGPVVHGFVVEHASTNYIPDAVLDAVDAGSTHSHPKHMVRYAAQCAFVTDVRSEVHSRIRKAVENAKRSAEA